MHDTTATHEHGSEACTCETTTLTENDHERNPDPAHGAGDRTPEASFGVVGMTCSHCVASVGEELGRLEGVTSVDVELVAGGVSRVTVASAATVDRDDVAAAIHEAGYEMVDLPR